MKTTRYFCISLIMIFLTGNFYLWAQDTKFTRTEDVIYGRKDGMALTMDIFQPERPNGIAVIVLISGGWYSSHDLIDIEWIGRIKQLIDKGETVFAVVHGSMPKYKISDIQKDIDRAVRFVRLNAAKWGVDPESIGIVGHSSGGHLSLLHAATAKDSSTSINGPIGMVSAKVQAVACFYPPTDFLYFGSKGLNALSNPKFKRFLPAFINDINDTTSLVKVAEEVSPIRYVTSNMPPTLIISGNADKLVPFMQSQLLINRLNELKIPCHLEVREGKDHGWPEIEKDYKFVAEWFEKYLKKHVSIN
ncbi:MAG: alpha/beta hydrolase [Bacteroidota bacterium]|nr:alpha/beta hydrolase [Bacteroidota bacterium]